MSWDTPSVPVTGSSNANHPASFGAHRQPVPADYGIEDIEHTMRATDQARVSTNGASLRHDALEEQLARVKDLHEQVDNVKAQLSIQEKQAHLREETLQQTVGELRDVLEQMSAENEALREKLGTSQSQAIRASQQHEVDINRLEARLSTALAEVKQRDAELLDAARDLREAAQVKKQSNLLQDSVYDLEDTVNGREQEIEGLKEALDVREMELELARKTNSTQQSLVHNLKQQISEMERKLQDSLAVEQRCIQLEAQLADKTSLQLRVGELESECASLRDANGAHKREKEGLVSSLEQARSEMRNLESAYSEARAAVAELTGPGSEIESLRQQVKYVMNEKESIASDLKELREEYNTASQERSTLEGINRRTVQELATELQLLELLTGVTASGEYERLSEPFEIRSEMVSSSSSLSGALKSLRGSLIKAMLEVKSLKENKIQLSTKNQEMSAEVADIRASKAQLQSTLFDSQKELHEKTVGEFIF